MTRVPVLHIEHMVHLYKKQNLMLYKVRHLSTLDWFGENI